MKTRFTVGHLLYIYVPIIALIVICATGCEKQFIESKFLMSTMVDITAVGDRGDCHRAMKLAFEEIRRIDSLMNVYGENSEISRINRASGGSAVEVSADTLEVIERSLQYARLTNGALDVTVAPLMELWGFGGDSNQIPPDNQLEKTLSLVNYKKIIVDKNRSTIRLASPGMKIDVSGIAKGYAVDRAVQVLKQAGIQSALVNAGGDIYAIGSPQGRGAWRIGIRHPRDAADLLGIVELKNEAIATSGDYENFFEVNGKRYCHIMDTKTGKPVIGIISVTIVADNTAEADALATAIFPLGAEGGMKLIESIKGVDGIIVIGEKNGAMETLISSGMKGRLKPA